MRNERFRWTGAGCALLVAALTALVLAQWRPLLSYDDRVTEDLHGYAVLHPGVTQLMGVLSDWVWDPWTMRVLAAMACVWLWWRGDRERAVRVALATVIASAVQQGLKALVGRERPVWTDPLDSAQYAAYPSGHAMTATVVCGMLLWLLPRRPPEHPAGQERRAWPVWTAWAAWSLALVSVLGVGFTRVYLGVHWPSDVLAGWLLGVVVVVCATTWGARAGRDRVRVRLGS